MKKLIISLFLLCIFSVSSLAAVFDSSIDSTGTENMIFRMNLQNTNGSRGAYLNTTVPKIGWLNLNGYTTAPVTANMVTGNAVVYFDYTDSSPVLKVWFKDVAGNVVQNDIGVTTNVIYTFASTAALTNATVSGTLGVTGISTVATVNSSYVSGNIVTDGTAILTAGALSGLLTASIVTATISEIVVPTSAATKITGNVNILVRDSSGTKYYIKANTSP